MAKPSKAAIKSQVDNVLIDASARKPKPTKPLPDGADLSGDLNIGPTHKKLLSGDYNHIIHSHDSSNFISPSQAGAFTTVKNAVDEVFARI